MNKLFTLAVVAILTGSALVWSAPPVPRQRIDPTRIDPVDAMGRREPVDEQDRLSEVRALRSNVDERDARAVRGKLMQHAEGPGL